MMLWIVRVEVVQDQKLKEATSTFFTVISIFNEQTKLSAHVRI